MGVSLSGNWSIAFIVMRLSIVMKLFKLLLTMMKHRVKEIYKNKKWKIAIEALIS